MYFQTNSCNTHPEHKWAQGTFLREWRKVPPAHAQQVYLEEHSEGSPQQTNVSVCLSVWNTKTRRVSRRNYNQGVHVEFSVCCLSPPNIYSYVQEENLGSTRKFVEIYLLFTCMYYQPNSCTTHAEREWAGGNFLRQQKKVPHVGTFISNWEQSEQDRILTSAQATHE